MAATPSTYFLCAICVVGCLTGVKGERCESYGECGLNGICQVVGKSARCTCPAGFDFSDKKEPSKGCFQNPPQQMSKCSGSSSKMVDEGHVDWSGNDYETTTSISEATCKQTCLDDCFCTVVIYATLEGTGYCWKKSLPLRDGRASITRTAFVKVSKNATRY
ncbi:hypothetical protein SUGI_0104570 [Cryptomeria japonica]|nr:hypothetical protein SUGI_0104570 [Cryptomeria japonica]